MIPLILVDDDPDMLNLMQLTFSDSGNYEVIACQDARDALEVLKQRTVSVIISDFKMPGDDWWPVCQGRQGHGIFRPVYSLFRKRKRSIDQKSL